MPVKPDDFHHRTGKKKDVLLGDLPDTKTKARCSFLVKFILCVLFIGDIVLLALWQDAIDSKRVLEERLVTYCNKFLEETRQKEELEKKHNQLKKNISNTIFRVGAKRSSASGGSYDSGYKLFFYTYKPILLKSVYVAASVSVNDLRVILYDMFDKEIRTTDAIVIKNSSTWKKINLDFKIKPGRYYLTFNGKTRLYYHSKELEYPYKIKDIIEITGSGLGNDYNKKNYFQYFYEWEVSLIFE